MCCWLRSGRPRVEKPRTGRAKQMGGAAATFLIRPKLAMAAMPKCPVKCKPGLPRLQSAPAIPGQLRGGGVVRALNRAKK